jgi:N-acetylneuraminic acid mutarotase
VATASNVPGARYGSVSWRDSTNKLWLFGGFGYDSTGVSGSLNDLWKFDGTNWTWVSGATTTNQSGNYGTKGAAAASNVPGARYNAISWIDSNNNLWLFGGVGVGGSLPNDLWKFDGTNWSWVSGSNATSQYGVYGTKGVGDASNVPGSRYWSVSWIDTNSTLWLFGGAGLGAASIGSLNDLWCYHPWP